MNVRALKLYFFAIIWTPGSLGSLKIICLTIRCYWNILSETIRIGLIDQRDNLPFQALDNISGEYFGYYMDLAKTIVQMSGFDHMQIINSSKYDDLGQFSYPSQFLSFHTH